MSSKNRAPSCIAVYPPPPLYKVFWLCSSLCSYSVLLISAMNLILHLFVVACMSLWSVFDFVLERLFSASVVILHFSVIILIIFVVRCCFFVVALHFISFRVLLKSFHWLNMKRYQWPQTEEHLVGLFSNPAHYSEHAGEPEVEKTIWKMSRMELQWGDLMQRRSLQ